MIALRLNSWPLLAFGAGAASPVGVGGSTQLGERFGPGSAVPRLDLDRLEMVFAQLQRQGMGYKLGAKADDRKLNPRAGGRLGAGPETLEYLDCSGAIRYLVFQATRGALVLPDGSQNQRAWCEERASHGQLHRVAKYPDVARYMTARRLFLAFIKPWTNGCGAVGHVWLVAGGPLDGRADGGATLQGNPQGNPQITPHAATMECYGGHGVGSRPWNERVLAREVHSVYELPVGGG